MKSMDYDLVKTIYECKDITQLAKVLGKSAGLDQPDLRMVNHILVLRDNAEKVGYKRAAEYVVKAFGRFAEDIEFYLKDYMRD